MYIEGSPQYLYHLRHYGHPSKFGYKDLVQLWKAEKFEPEALMERYYKAGARYFIAQAMHHDHFFNYPSKLNRFNSMQAGPKKDIIGLWKKAAEKYSMPFGFTEHLGATFSWWGVNKGADKYGPYAGVPYDGSDPAYRDFYLDNFEHYHKDKNSFPIETWNTSGYPDYIDTWYTSNPKHHEYWLNVMKEVIDLYTPDLIYTDGVLPFGNWGGKVTETHEADPVYKYGLEAAAYLYNKSIAAHGENRAVYTQKDRQPEIYEIGVLDVEKSQLPKISPKPWQVETCIGNWFYDARQVFKRPGHIIEMLVDIISKNGTMLLNILQLPDGSLDDETGFILDELGSWTSIAGEGVYNTRPWRVFGEGPTSVLIEGFKEVAAPWTEADFRFTSKGKTLYAFMMRTPEKRSAVIQSFREDEKISAVKLLGVGAVPFSFNYGVLTIKLPEKMPTQYTNCFAIELD
jgi:alpha-L-fucosidase